MPQMTKLIEVRRKPITGAVIVRVDPRLTILEMATVVVPCTTTCMPKSALWAVHVLRRSLKQAIVVARAVHVWIGWRK